MIVFWRGWGILVLLVPFAWIFLLVGIMIGWGTYEPDPQKAAAFTYRLFGRALLLAAITLEIVVRYRARVAPGHDTFTFIPMKYWTYVVAAGAVILFAMSFFPSSG
jgi:hypothetical protein